MNLCSFGMEPAPFELGSLRKGKGGTVILDTPLAVAQKKILSNGGRSFTLSERQIDQMVENFKAWREEGGPPAPGFFAHARTPEERMARKKEDPAFHVLDVWRKGTQMWGTVEFFPDAWKRVYADGAMRWRGLSIRFAPFGKDRTGKEVGSVFYGADLVHDPFLPVQIAADKHAEDDLAGDFYGDSFVPFANEAIDPNNNMLYLSSRCIFQLDAAPEGGQPDKDRRGKEDAAMTAEEKKQLDTLLARVEALEKADKEKDEALSAANKRADDAEAKLKAKEDEEAQLEKQEAGRKAQETIKAALERGLIQKADVEGYDKDIETALSVVEKLDPITLMDRMTERAKKGEFSPKSGNLNQRKEDDKTGADEKDRLQLSHPDATEVQLSEMEAQGPFLSKVDNIYDESQKGDSPVTYREAMRLAAEKYPEEFAEYNSAVS